MSNNINAEKLLADSRKKIDEIDNQIINLILERTSLAEDIITAKKELDMDLFDASRENIIHEKIRNVLADKDIDTEKVLEIFDLLATINKQEQKKYL
jgi:chorismate mutase